jgi:urease accessory protein
VDHVPTDLLLMLFADARLPVAGHTQSAGLEAAVQHGLTSAEVPAYMSARLATTVRVEAGTAVVALHRLDHELPLEPVVAAWAARTPSHALRRTSRAQGRAMNRLSASLWADGAAVRRVARLDGCPRPVALAGAAAAAGLDALSLARLVGYDDVQTVASASLKLLPRDHRMGARRPSRGRRGRGGRGRVDRSTRHPRDRSTPDRGVGAGPRPQHTEVVQCLTRPPPAASDSASAAPSAPARAR